MYISIPARDCRIAIGKALEEVNAGLDKVKDEVREASFKALYEGAVHNGMRPTPTQIEEMRAMVERDLEHMMPNHPSVQTMEVLQNMDEMLDFNSDPFITIDDQDFHLLKGHLPKLEKLEDNEVNEHEETAAA